MNPPEQLDLFGFTDLNDVEELQGITPPIRIVAPGTAYCSCGRRAWVRVGGIREPLFPPGFTSGIVQVGEPRKVCGWRDSWMLRYVCDACRHHYLDFAQRMTREEAEEMALRSNSLPEL